MKTNMNWTIFLKTKYELNNLFLLVIEINFIIIFVYRFAINFIYKKLIN